MLRSAPLANHGQSLAQAFIRRLGLEKGLAQRAQVKARPADYERNVTSCFYLFDFTLGIARPVARSVVDFGRHKIYQVMRYAAPLFKRNFGRRNLYLTINLHGIAIDNLAAEPQGERDPQIAFTG